MFQPLEGGHGGHVVYVRRRRARRDVPAHRAQRPARRLHGRVEPGPHRRRLRSRAAATTPRCTGTAPAPSRPGCRSSSPPRCTATAPHHSYVCGRQRRRPALAAVPGELPRACGTAAMPSTSGGQIAEPGNTKRVKAGSVMSFGAMFNVQRLLGRDAHHRPRRPHGARRQRRPVRRAHHARARGARQPVPAGLRTRQRVHDQRADGPDVAVDVAGRGARQPRTRRTSRTSGPQPGYVGHDHARTRR